MPFPAMKNNSIQRADENDLIPILALQKKAFQAVAELMNTCDLPPLRQTFPDIYKEYQQGVILKFLSENGRIIGSVRAFMNTDQTCCVGKLVVHPGFQNRGIGKALMYAIENYFPACRRFSLFTGEATPGTRHVYSRVGYRPVCKKEMDGITMIVMEKENVG